MGLAEQPMAMADTAIASAEETGAQTAPQIGPLRLSWLRGAYALPIVLVLLALAITRPWPSC
jgi:hypothetical protein